MRRSILLSLAFAAASFIGTTTSLSVSSIERAVSTVAGPKTDEPLSCETCEVIISAVSSLGDNSTTVAELIALIDEGCTVIDLPLFQVLCDEIAAAGVNISAAAFAFLDKELNTLAWDIPLNFCSVFVPVCKIPCCDSNYAPEQLRLAPAPSSVGLNALSVTWITLNETQTSTVQWGLANGPMNYSAVGVTRTYTLGGWIGVIHEAIMTNLLPGTQYTYTVGSTESWSTPVTFSTLPSNAGTPSRPLTIINIGDMGWGPKSNATIARMNALIDAGLIDAVVHQGDVSYADGAEQNWDVFGRKIQSISSRVPYLVSPGNHEQVWWGGLPYRTRWSMPPPMDTSGNPLPLSLIGNRSFFSVDFGKVHWVMFDTESPLDLGDVPVAEADWIKADITKARTSSPSQWIVTAAHRPLYCTNGNWKSSDKDCFTAAGVLRGQIEASFISAKVDILLTAHMHGYERTVPVANSIPTVGATTYIVNGAGGNRESNDNPAGDAPWSVPGAHFADIGYGLMTIVTSPTPGASWLQYQFIRSADGTVLDMVNITK